MAMTGAERSRKYRARHAKQQTEAQRKLKVPPGASPLDYMLAVMRDETAKPERRDRMAIAAAPLVHTRPIDDAPGKKAETKAKAARVASTGRLATPPPPKAAAGSR